MPVLAAIDIGSNAMRLVTAEVDAERHLTILDNIREAVRLGQDVFIRGSLSDAVIDQAAAALKRFAETISLRGAKWTRAVATSAVREALNKDLFADRIAQESGIELSIIGPEEEARLIYLAVAQRIPLKGKLAMLVDIGGGSTEITLTADGEILSTESFRMGTVRLLQLLEGKKHGERYFHQLVQEYVDASQRRVKKEIGDRTIDICVGTGGNIDTLADLLAAAVQRDRIETIPVGDLEALSKKLIGMSFEERMTELRLRPDRADVIVPASIVLLKIVKQARVGEVLVPRVGLKEGLLLDMVEELYGDRTKLQRGQVLSSALQLGRKYSFDEQHGTTVARFAVQLFDETKAMHHLPLDNRLLLEVAALLHDIGSFVGATNHHKHTLYLLMASAIIGLTQGQMAMVANIARYHRKSMPKSQHDTFRALSSKERVAVVKLAALLRLADAMDNEHAAKVHEFTVEYKKPKFILRLRGEGDLLLEKWSLMKKGEAFEEVFSVTLAVEDA